MSLAIARHCVSAVCQQRSDPAHPACAPETWGKSAKGSGATEGVGDGVGDGEIEGIGVGDGATEGIGVAATGAGDDGEAEIATRDTVGNGREIGKGGTEDDGIV